MRYAMVNYRWDFDEFFLYHFDQLTHQERLSFVTEYEKNIFCDQVNNPKCQEVFDNKWLTYQKFKKYYGRNVLLSNQIDNLQFEEYALKHKAFIVKPIVSSLGKGIKKVLIDGTLSYDKLFKKLVNDYPRGFIIEDLIEQDERIGAIHPQSVNTLRVHTIRLKDGVKVFRPYLRMGRGDSVVDNAGAGGIFTSVDMTTGIITKAVDELGRFYTIHPDSGVELVGFHIPQWDEALKTAKELAEVIPENRYTGWDLALAKNGWVMVEGNTRAQMVFQIPEQKGFREEFNIIINKL